MYFKTITFVFVSIRAEQAVFCGVVFSDQNKWLVIYKVKSYIVQL